MPPARTAVYTAADQLRHAMRLKMKNKSPGMENMPKVGVVKKQNVTAVQRKKKVLKKKSPVVGDAPNPNASK